MKWNDHVYEIATCPLCSSNQYSPFVDKLSPIVGLSAKIVQCRKCLFIYSQTRLDPSGLQNFYKVKYSESNYVTYRDNSKIKIHNFKNTLRRLASLLPKANKKMLDLGCSYGYALEAARSLNMDAVGVEIDPTAAKEAQTRSAAPIVCAALETPQTQFEEQFGGVTLFDVLDHVEDLKAVLRNTLSYLAPNGIVYADVANINSPYRYLMGRRYIHILPFEHLSYFSKASLKAAFQSAGFEVLSVGAAPRFVTLDFLLSTLGHFLKWPWLQDSLKLIPKSLAQVEFPLYIGAIEIMARKPASR